MQVEDSRGGYRVILPGSELERKVLLRLIRDAISGREFPIMRWADKNPGVSGRTAHFYLFDSEPPVDGWFRAVIDVARYLADDDFMAWDQIPGRLGVILDGRDEPEVTFYADDTRRFNTLAGTLRPVLSVADFGQHD